MTALDMELAEIRKGTRPILIGPWLSEVGFELLYWIPFLRKALAGIPPERLWVLSRGGCRSWYADLTPNYLELFDAYTPADLIRLNRARIREQASDAARSGLRKGQITAKQFTVSSVEEDMMLKMARTADLGEVSVLHPSLMYRAFRPVWRKRSKTLFDNWQHMTAAQRIQPPVFHVELPNRFVAVKFYASQANPNIPAREAFVQRIVRAISDVMDVVLLHTGMAFDEHGEFTLPVRSRVHQIRYDAATNLDLQTAIIAKAEAFVGTYGGFAYLAPFLGIPTIALYGTRNFRTDHLRLMKQVASHTLRTPFEVSDLEPGLAMVKRQRQDWMAHAA